MNSIAGAIAVVIVVAAASAFLWARILKHRVEFRAEASIAAALTSGALYLLIVYLSERPLSGLWPVIFIAVTLIAGCVAFAVISRVFRSSSQKGSH
jgi:hypothetical protein